CTLSIQDSRSTHVFSPFYRSAVYTFEDGANGHFSFGERGLLFLVASSAGINATFEKMTLRRIASVQERCLELFSLCLVCHDEARVHPALPNRMDMRRGAS